MVEIFTINSKNIILRLPNLSDVKDLLEIYSDRETMELYGSNVNNDYILLQNTILDFNYKFTQYEKIYCVIESKEDLKVIGFILINYLEYEWQLEFAINKNYRNKGYASQAIDLLLNFCKENGLNKILAKAQVHNSNSIVILKKFGFIPRENKFYTIVNDQQ